MKYIFFCFAFSLLLFSACKKDNPQPGPDDNNPPIDTTTTPVDTTPFLIEPGTRPLVIAHRGGKGLMPENTMLAFDNAVSMGVDVLEMDVVLTKDSILVTIHDVTINSTSNGTGNVQDYTYQELQQLNFGHNFQDSTGAYPYRNDTVRIPMLKDVLLAHPDEYLNIEIKDPGTGGMWAAEQLVALIKAHGKAKNVIAFSFQDDVMAHFHTINDEGIFAGASLQGGLSFYQAVQLGTDSTVAIRADVFSIPTSFGSFNFANDSIIDAAHRRQVAVHFWTINDKAEMKTLIQMGADAIITDRPDRMLEVLTELGF